MSLDLFKRIVMASAAMTVLIGLICATTTKPGPDDGPTAYDRIVQSCNDEYGVTTDEANDCKVRLGVRHLEEVKADRLEHAAREAGVE